MKKAYLFPGQGSQKKGMGYDHYRYNKSFKLRCDQADGILGYRITEIMFHGPDSTLTETKHTQPALFIHSVALFEMIGHKADMVAGHSLGEYSALAAVGAIEFEQALSAVQRRGELMQAAGELQPGSMAAIIGLDDSVVDSTCREISEKPHMTVVPANYNTHGQLVISGNLEAVEMAMTTLKEKGAKIVKKLPVSGAFHSPLMESALTELQNILDELRFSKPQAPVYSNVSGTSSKDPELLKERLKKQLLHPVQWVKTMENIFNDGAKHFIEIGSGNVLQGLVKRTLKNIEISGFQ